MIRAFSMQHSKTFVNSKGEEKEVDLINHKNFMYVGMIYIGNPP